MQKIKEAAIYYKWVIYTWKRHFNCIAKAHEATKDKPIIANGWRKGFVDEAGEYYSRAEAAMIAIAAKQITNLRYSKTELYSEDLY